MKYVSVVVILLAMNWTWGLAHRKQPIPEQTHVGLQEDLKRIISEYIQENRPNSNNLIFTKFWTEPLSDRQVKAHFVYSFEDSDETAGDAKVEIAGDAVLNREQETAESSVWSLEDLSISSSAVDYKSPIQVNE